VKVFLLNLWEDKAQQDYLGWSQSSFRNNYHLDVFALLR